LADVGDGWCASAARARLEKEQLAALELRIEAQLARGPHPQAIAELDALTAANPLRGRLWHYRLLAPYRCGPQAKALHADRELRATLTEQQGSSRVASCASSTIGSSAKTRASTTDPPVRARACPTPAGCRPAMPKAARLASPYQVLGEGRRDIVFVPGAMSHLDLPWEGAETLISTAASPGSAG
jgi:hypothetical protein